MRLRPAVALMSVVLASTAMVTGHVAAAASAAPLASATRSGGCAQNSAVIPHGADVSRTGDLDDDGRADRQFSAERASGGFYYGIRTAAGSVHALTERLAGPGTHGGWAVRLTRPAVTAVLVDDGRVAELHAFVGCRFVTPRGVNGKPYQFGLDGFYSAGTGVTCLRTHSGTRLAGVLARRRSNGRYDLITTVVHLSADGKRAVNGATTTTARNLASSDPRVRHAEQSYCSVVPRVSSGGK